MPNSTTYHPASRLKLNAFNDDMLQHLPGRVGGFIDYRKVWDMSSLSQELNNPSYMQLQTLCPRLACKIFSPTVQRPRVTQRLNDIPSEQQLIVT